MGTNSPKIDFFRQLEEKLLLPNIRQSLEELTNLIADTFVEYGSSGHIYQKQDVIAALQSEVSSRIAITDFQMVRLGEEAVLITYKATCQTFNVNLAAHSLRSSIWQLISGQWQIIFHQGTPIH